MKVIIVKNSLFPFPGYIAMTVWPFIFVRKKAAARYGAAADNHERIHAAQQVEMLVAGIFLGLAAFLSGLGFWALAFLPVFFLWYAVEWACRFIQYRDTKKAYRNIAFEREAYRNEGDTEYLHQRKLFSWISHL